MKRALFLPISLGGLVAACGGPGTVAALQTNQRAPLSFAATAPSVTATAPSANPVVQWNRILLQIVRTPGAQPSTVHPTRSFAILHAAIYDAVNAIDRAHRPYLVPFSERSRNASQDAAAAAAAHEVLVALYPSFSAQLDEQLQQSLAQVSNEAQKTKGVRIGKSVADRIVELRSGDQSAAKPIAFVFGDDPGNYQSTPPNFPAQPQFHALVSCNSLCAGTGESVSSRPSSGADQ